MIRSIWFYLNGVIATILLGTVAMLVGALGGPAWLHRWIAQNWSRWLLFASGTRVDVEGSQHIATDRPQIIVSNHASYFDVIAIAANLPRRSRFIAKQELGRVPIFGPAWKAAGHISIDRNDRPAAIAALRRAGEIMRHDGSVVVVFPEGTRSGSGELLPFKKGAFMLALVTGAEIVPTAVLGSRAILPRNSWRVRRGRITLRFAPPVDTTSYDESNRDELIARVRGTVQQLLAGPLPRVDRDGERVSQLRPPAEGE